MIDRKVLSITVTSKLLRWLLKLPVLRLFTQFKENVKAPRHWLFVRGIHRWPVNSLHKGPVTRKMFPFDDVIMVWQEYILVTAGTLITLAVANMNRQVAGGLHKYMARSQCFNSLCSVDAYIFQWTRLSFATNGLSPVRPRHYTNRRWLIFKQTSRNKFRWNLNHNIFFFLKIYLKLERIKRQMVFIQCILTSSRHNKNIARHSMSFFNTIESYLRNIDTSIEIKLRSRYINLL